MIESWIECMMCGLIEAFKRNIGERESKKKSLAA